jgi:predicted ribosome-associated RNA-binding protein Tma20
MTDIPSSSYSPSLDAIRDMATVEGAVTEVAMGMDIVAAGVVGTEADVDDAAETDCRDQVLSCVGTKNGAGAMLKLD